MRGRIAGTAAVALLLGGCWDSTAQLMPENAKDAPPLSGEYVQTGSTAPIRYQVTPRGKQALLAKSQMAAFVDEYMLSFDALPGRGNYLVQAAPFTPARVQWIVLTVDGAAVRKMIPLCNYRAIHEFGATQSSDTCQFSSYAGLRGAAEAMVADIAAGQSASWAASPEDFVRK